MDRWLDGTIPGISVPGVMGYFARQDLPFYYALADAFTICDGYHCSVLGPTTPNRLYLWSGMVDAEGRYGGPIRSNDRPIALRWTTYAERLQKAGVSWRVYQQEDNFDDNALAWFDVFQRAQPGSPLYENGMRRRPEQAFADDVRNDRLPNVSWLVAPGWESEHPDHRPSDGAALCSRYLAALASNPAVWEKTLFILNYDEHGGAFDHVPPPSPPKGTPGEFIGTESIGLGFRVPCIVVSPWSQGGWVCGNVFDHTSVLRLLETVFAVREPNISQWRRATCGNLIDAVDLSHPVTSFPKLPSTGPEQERANCAGKSLKYPVYGGEPMPPQEAGTRPRRTGTSSGTGGGSGAGGDGGSGSGGSADGGGSGGSGTTRTTGAPATDGGTTSTLLPEGTTSVPGPGGSLPTGSTSTTRRPRRARSASGDNDTAAPTAIAVVAALASAAATARMAWRRSGRAGAGGPSGASGAGAAGLGPVERARPLRAPDPSGPNPAGPADPAGADPGATDRPGAGGA
jgi:phospholipase C